MKQSLWMQGLLYAESYGLTEMPSLATLGMDGFNTDDEDDAEFVSGMLDYVSNLKYRQEERSMRIEDFKEHQLATILTAYSLPSRFTRREFDDIVPLKEPDSVLSQLLDLQLVMKRSNGIYELTDKGKDVNLTTDELLNIVAKQLV